MWDVEDICLNSEFSTFVPLVLCLTIVLQYVRNGAWLWPAHNLSHLKLFF